MHTAARSTSLIADPVECPAIYIRFTFPFAAPKERCTRARASSYLCECQLIIQNMKLPPSSPPSLVLNIHIAPFTPASPSVPSPTFEGGTPVLTSILFRFTASANLCQPRTHAEYTRVFRTTVPACKLLQSCESDNPRPCRNCRHSQWHPRKPHPSPINSYPSHPPLTMATNKKIAMHRIPMQQPSDRASPGRDCPARASPSLCEHPRITRLIPTGTMPHRATRVAFAHAVQTLSLPGDPYA